MDERYNPPAFKPTVLNSIQEECVATYLYLALIITSVALIGSVILQSKGAGLGGLTGGDTGGIFTARRGIEKVLFRVTIGLSFLFFFLAIATTMVVG
jgi:preprotein translocase subunit SecG